MPKTTGGGPCDHCFALGACSEKKTLVAAHSLAHCFRTSAGPALRAGTAAWHFAGGLSAAPARRCCGPGRWRKLRVPAVASHVRLARSVGTRGPECRTSTGRRVTLRVGGGSDAANASLWRCPFPSLERPARKIGSVSSLPHVSPTRHTRDTLSRFLRRALTRLLALAESPQWRRGPVSKPVLCNACGTRYRRNGNLNGPSFASFSPCAARPSPRKKAKLSRDGRAAVAAC